MGMLPRDDDVAVLLGRAPTSDRPRSAPQSRTRSPAADASPLQQFAVESTATTQMLLQQDLGHTCKEHWNCKDWLVCSDGVCSSCSTNSQCQERNDFRQCFSNISWAVEGELPYNVCKHKPLFFPFTWSDFVLAIITFLTIALAAPTGTGGGGILVPMYMIIGQFSAHSAVPLSKATILGGAVANNIINIQRRHPFANRPVVDYDSLQVPQKSPAES